MMRFADFERHLYVDVDDTLILWGKPYGDVGNPVPNADVIEFVKRWHKANPHGRITIWSLGGKDYAGKWAVETGVPHDDFSDKFWVSAKPGDLFIDDDPLACYAQDTIHPDFIKGLANGQ